MNIFRARIFTLLIKKHQFPEEQLAKMNRDSQDGEGLRKMKNETIGVCQGFRGLPFSLLFAIMKNLRISSLFFVALVSVAGCSKSSTSADPATTGAIPAVGSSFTTLDNNSNTTFDTIKAIPSGLGDTAHHGSTSIEISVTQSSNGGNNMYYESFLTNGDIALEGSTSGWGATGVYEELPFVTHTTVIDTFTQSNAGNIIRDSVVTVYNGAGKPFVLNNSTYQTDSVTVTVFYVGLGASLQYGYSFMPALGLIAYYSNSNATQWTTSYTPK
jgi:hypothetical protein